MYCIAIFVLESEGLVVRVSRRYALRAPAGAIQDPIEIPRARPCQMVSLFFRGRCRYRFRNTLGGQEIFYMG